MWKRELLVVLILFGGIACEAFACGREKVCGSYKSWGIYKGCCESDGALFVYIDGEEVCVTKTKADFVLWIFGPRMLTLCVAAVLLIGVCSFSGGRRCGRIRRRS
jgi:hypothetical protein